MLYLGFPSILRLEIGSLVFLFIYKLFYISIIPLQHLYSIVVYKPFISTIPKQHFYSGIQALHLYHTLAALV